MLSNTGFKIAPWIRLSRCSNLPTLLSNVLVAWTFSSRAFDLQFFYVFFFIAVFYTLGMFLNDICDLDFDKKAGINRPLVLGEIKVSHAVTATLIMMLTGVSYFAFCGWRPFLYSLLLLGSIVGYDLRHKVFPASVLLMGVCRMLVYPLSYFVFTIKPFPPALMVASLVMGLWTLGLTAQSRNRFKTKRGKRIVSTLMVLLPAGLPLFLYFTGNESASLQVIALSVGVVIFFVKLLFSSIDQIPNIGKLIAGMCFLDAIVLLFFNHHVEAFVCITLYFFTNKFQKVIRGV